MNASLLMFPDGRKICLWLIKHCTWKTRNASYGINIHRFTSSSLDFQSYCQLRNKLRNLTRSLHKAYESNLASNRRSNAKCFWKYVNSHLKVHPAINAIWREDNSIADSKKEKCELLNKFFTSVFTEEDCTTIPSFQFNDNPSHLNDIDITPVIVLD